MPESPPIARSTTYSLIPSEKSLFFHIRSLKKVGYIVAGEPKYLDPTILYMVTKLEEVMGPDNKMIPYRVTIMNAHGNEVQIKATRGLFVSGVPGYLVGKNTAKIRPESTVTATMFMFRPTINKIKAFSIEASLTN